MSVKYISKASGLRGTVNVPGDKSISHRAVMLGSIALGTTEITHFLEGADCLATIGCFRKMGVEIEQKPKSILVHGKGLRGLCAPDGVLDVGNSGTTTRLLSGILCGQTFTSVLSGDESLNSRPMGRIITPLGNMGAAVTSVNGSGCAPLKIEPGTIHGIHYESPVASAQVKSAVLLAGLYADSETSVTEPALSRNHTELMLQSFGAALTATMHPDGRATATVAPCRELYGQQIDVPGDISSAAYFIAAGLTVPGSELLIKNVGINFTRAGFLKACQNMGADITLKNETIQSGEPRADILVKPSRLHGTVIEGDLIPSLIDEIPVIAVMAACAEGTTVIRDAAELKVKETDRIQTVTENLRAMGAHITPTEDGMVIEGGRVLKGASIESHMDHRIAMSFAVAGLSAEGETQIHNSQCVDVSYPTFWETIESLH
ncbi:3-phosphoshikimate 1-carboxyvinyltransferase [Dorea sp. D27]|uniref:3-phosphoshikimate 1-carboxyvinyltransferase n=1 Tax=Dorea sp. D27 TaxID=658665 RepID=UPI000673676B|nr:3-phosphoshikimate 1-carboxyvinyltransferase [Dorea sp. D27]KMZ55587.1 3-phosphoshikimate 1-carboxyvinyltransferase [Dorea sp. D27]